jgi:hypothetical protein
MEKLTKKTEYADLPIVIFHTKDGRRKSTKLVVMPEDHYFDIISELKTLKEKQNRELSSSVPED